MFDIIAKAIVYLSMGIFITAIFYSIIRGFFDKKTAKEILKDPCYVDATITEIMPGTPTSYGLVNITVDYSFTAINGETYTKKNVLTGIKTMDLPKFNVGFTIPVVYLRNDPSKNMLNMRNAIEDYVRFRWKKKS
ncbi:hypothetical protein IAE49_12240 [Kosakonia sp. S58]|uniref:hypothetical protein n=1 Tax=unclassified Kosakonia TaxID=2632876 RepID=UPI00190455BF|nr:MULTISPECIES: hypothetical protein [unclassified Kosakonia]MBK0079356.1 hypothetical protein [Kosakonia sp. S57]MBK0087003.1 hypothetical protein [Kosakonia sp. S58]